MMNHRFDIFVALGFLIGAAVVLLAGFSLIQLFRTANITWMLGLIPFCAMLALGD